MSIPASDIVQVNPGVIGAGGNPLALNGLLLSKSAYIPIGTVQSLTSAAAVRDFFGAASAEYALAQTYFLGFDNSTKKPGQLLFAPFADVDRAAWLQGGSMAGVTLTELQALSGVLAITVDGAVKTSATINLSAATSFSNAATLIAAGFTGSPLTCVWDAVKSRFILTSATSGVGSTMTFATGTLSAGLLLTSATGAILSQGIDAQTLTAAMDAVVDLTQNWAALTTIFEPDAAGKIELAEWVTNQNQRYLYAAWDTDAQAIVNGSTTCFGSVAKAAEYDGVMPISGDASVVTSLATSVRELAVFVLGTIASIDFSRRNGRITGAFKHQAGFVPNVQSSQVAENLLANGYSFYGHYATANDDFNFLYNGQITGRWLWMDTFVDQIYMNSQFQLALMALLTQINSIPYNESGYSLIRAAMKDPIDEMLNFGGIRTGVVLSASQIAQVNTAAGKDVAKEIEQLGYYLQILDPGAQVRGLRGTPVINFWYTDGGAVQNINIASIDII